MSKDNQNETCSDPGIAVSGGSGGAPIKNDDAPITNDVVVEADEFSDADEDNQWTEIPNSNRNMLRGRLEKVCDRLENVATGLENVLSQFSSFESKSSEQTKTDDNSRALLTTSTTSRNTPMIPEWILKVRELNLNLRQKKACKFVPQNSSTPSDSVGVPSKPIDSSSKPVQFPRSRLDDFFT